MKIELIIDEKAFDEQVGNFIKAKVKQVLRSDKQLIELIQDTVQKEVEKKVATAFLVSKFDDQYLEQKVSTILREVKAKAENTAAHKIKQMFDPLLEERNRKVLSKLFSSEIKQIKKEKKK